MVAPREVRWVIGTRSAVLARLAVGGVWAYQGVWCKLLGRDAAQRRIVAGLPGRGRRCAAAVQTVAVAAMNAAGLRLARAEVPRPWRLLARNAAFLALAWAAAGDARG